MQTLLTARHRLRAYLVRQKKLAVAPGMPAAHTPAERWLRSAAEITEGFGNSPNLELVCLTCSSIGVRSDGGSRRGRPSFTET